MDGWSPGYLGSVAYNHNGMMRMYETQSGREAATGAPQGAGVHGAAAAAVATSGRGAAGAKPQRRGTRRGAEAVGWRAGEEHPRATQRAERWRRPGWPRRASG